MEGVQTHLPGPRSRRVCKQWGEGPDDWTHQWILIRTVGWNPGECSRIDAGLDNLDPLNQTLGVGGALFFKKFHRCLRCAPLVKNH